MTKKTKIFTYPNRSVQAIRCIHLSVLTYSDYLGQNNNTFRVQFKNMIEQKLTAFRSGVGTKKKKKRLLFGRYFPLFVFLSHTDACFARFTIVSDFNNVAVSF